MTGTLITTQTCSRKWVETQPLLNVLTSVNPTANILVIGCLREGRLGTQFFFLTRYRIVIDDKEMDKSLFKLVQDTLEPHKTNSVIAFHDNSSAIKGYDNVKTLLPKTPGVSSGLAEKLMDLDILFTAETHNFPTGVAPFPGAETGTGGRLRDTHATVLFHLFSFPLT